VRWSNLSLGEEEQRRLPGYRDEAVVRRFDAPEALQTNFYEVRAKSVLNRVPGKSQMPFRWTINVYRGCTHACTYCMCGDTGVLMADGRTKTLRDLQVGDQIYGTSRTGVHRKYETTTVLDKWSSLQCAYEVTLGDGTVLVTSDHHRFLSQRGWKHVTGTDSGPLKRPHLTVGLKLLGIGGGVTRPPDKDSDYRRGYLSGLIRGDGYMTRYLRTRRDGRTYTAHQFCLVLTDREALARAHCYLAEFGVEARFAELAKASGNHNATAVVRSGAKATFDRIQDLIAWPVSPSLSWQKGFLAGIYDAEGSCSHGTLSISNGDDLILRWTSSCLERLDFDYTIVDQRGRSKDGVAQIRLRGGMAANMRFWLTTDPAITRKRSIVGRRLWTRSDLRVASIRPLGVVMPMYDITTGTGDFIANGVVSHNCFARPTHKYLDFDAGRDFEREIVVKVNAPEVLRVELAKPSWKGEHVALGTNTDPYQWVEGRYKLMQGIWEAMRDAAGGAGNPCSVLTKSPLLLRDLPLMLQIAERTSISACLSIPTLDEKAWRATEPHTPNPRARLEAVAALNRAGIPTGVLIAPLMPGINDAPHQIEPLLQGAIDAGATSIGGVALHLRGEVKGIFMDWLRSQRPDLLERYEELYSGGAYAPKEERERLAKLVRRGAPSARGFRRLQPAARPPATDETLYEPSHQQVLF
jgi:DNA repair photolyase